MLDHVAANIGLLKVHLFGASLGGFLAQKFCQHTWKFQRVQSLVLCNAFTDTAVFTDLPGPTVYVVSHSWCRLTTELELDTSRALS